MQLRTMLADQSWSSQLFQLAQLQPKPVWRLLFLTALSWLLPYWLVMRIGFLTGHYNRIGIRLSKYELLIVEGLPSTKIFGITILLPAASQLLAMMNSSYFPSLCRRELSNQCLLHVCDWVVAMLWIYLADLNSCKNQFRGLLVSLARIDCLLTWWAWVGFA